MEAPKEFVDSRMKLVEEIKEKNPTLKELVFILKKNGIKNRKEMESFVIGWDIMQYVKKDKEYMSMTRKFKKLKSKESKNKLLDRFFSKLTKTKKN
jgi:hypothetical protein